MRYVHDFFSPAVISQYTFVALFFFSALSINGSDFVACDPTTPRCGPRLFLQRCIEPDRLGDPKDGCVEDVERFFRAFSGNGDRKSPDIPVFMYTYIHIYIHICICVLLKKYVCVCIYICMCFFEKIRV